MEGDQRGTTTVAFELAALESLQEPIDAFDQTRMWAHSVGVISDRPVHVITNFARRNGLDYGFTSGRHKILASLVAVRNQPEHYADRYVLIGTESITPAEVTERGWSFLPIEEAADAANWQLGTPTTADDTESAEREGWP